MTPCLLRHRLIFWLIAFAALQASHAEPLGRTSLEALGLTRSWTAQTAATRAEDVQMNLHLSKTRHTHVFDLVTDDGVRSFVEGTIGPRGRVMTKEEAERQADIAMRTLQLDGVQATVTPRLVPELTIIVQSPAGRVEAIDAETGRIKWEIAVGEPDYPGFAPTANELYTASLSGSALYVTEIATGKLVTKRLTRNIPGGSPTLTEDYVLVPLYRGAMEAMPLDPEEAKGGSTFLKSYGTPTAKPTLAGDVLCWPTDRGAIYFADGSRASDLFRVRTRDRVVGQIAFAPPHRFFAGTEDGFLICIDEKRESIAWDYLMGTPCAGTPYVLGDAVFVVTTDGILHCVDQALGTERWTRRGVRRTVGGLDQRLYARLFDGSLVAMDVTSGELLARATLPGGVRVLDNSLTDRIYLVTGGRISCYRNASSPWPTIYGVADAEPEEPPAAADEETAEETAAEEPMPDDSPSQNPFDSQPAADDDPFGGGPGADDDPFGGGSGSNDDPFGGTGADDDPFGGGAADDDPFG